MATPAVLVALTVLSLAGAGVVGVTMAAPRATGGMQSGYGGGMMNGGSGGMMGGQYGGGMMGGGSCPYQGNSSYCQQYMYEHNYSYGQCPMMG